MKLLLLALLAAGCHTADPDRLSAGQLAELRRAVESLEAQLAACTASFRAATAPAALGKLQLAAERCDAPLDAPARGSNAKQSLDARYFKVWPVRRFHAGEEIPASGCDAWGQSLRSARRRLDDGSADAFTLASVRGVLRNTIGSYEALVEVQAEQAPQPQNEALPGAGSFVPGSLSGRAFVYDYGAGHIVCGGDVHSASSDTVTVRYQYHEMNVLDAEWKRQMATPGALAGDAEAQLRRAIATQLRKVRP